jgi:hypothetical protein
MSTGVGQIPNADLREELGRKLGPGLDELAALVASPRHRFSTLRKDQVPQTAGLYIIYCEGPFEMFYVGRADVRGKAAGPSICDGLRFRIMENHLAYRGDDNFVKYIRKEFGLGSRAEAREHIKSKCSVHWMEVPIRRSSSYWSITLSRR